MHRRSASALAITLTGLTCAPAAAFTLFGFPTAFDIQNGQYNKWVRQPAHTPFTLHYKVDPALLTNQPPAVAAEARNAAARAFASWQAVTNGFITFAEETRWVGTVPNANPIPPRWEGPPIAEWLANQAYFQSLGINPGWGANIEIFSRPNGFTLQSQSYPLFQMTPNILGFTVVNRQAGRIVSAEIYLNESRNDWRVDGSPGFDVETVILHELGHTLGLDHPNQAVAMGGVNLDRYTFQSGAPWCTCDVMYSDYTGVKRVLTADESGAMSFLYPAGAGDLDGDGQLTFVDVARAFNVADSGVQPAPYTLRTLDFVDHNGAVGPLELAYMLQWATGAVAYSPDGPQQRGFPTASMPTAIAITAQATPNDVGKGGPVSVAVRIANQNAVAVLGWGFALQYDTAIFSNPRCTPGDFPAGSLKIATLADDGAIEIQNVAVAPDSSTAALLVTLTFDVNLQTAAAAGSSTFVIASPSLVVNVGGVIRNYGDPGETLTLTDAQVIASDLDANDDGVVDLLDLYAWSASPIDVNHDSVVNDADRRRLSDCLRRDEVADILPLARRSQ